MDLEIAKTVFAAMSALSSLVTAYKTARSLFKPFSRNDVKKTIDDAEQLARKNTKAAKDLGNVIDDDVLDIIRKNIEKEKERLKKSLGDPSNDNAEKDKAIDKANSTICAELQRIKRLNKGKLPGKEYDKWWDSHGCVT